MKHILQKALAVGVIAASSSVMALPVFTFTESAGFEIDDVAIASYTGQINGATTPAQDVYSSMNWYDTSATKSVLTLNSYTGAAPIGIWTDISQLVHNNNPITSNELHGWGTPQDIFGRLIISDEGGVVLDDTSLITITLEETLNQSPCAIPNPTGSLIPCDDFFTFTDIGLGALNFTASDSTLWTVSFRLNEFVNSAQTADGIYTSESATSSLKVEMLLTQRVSEVPEPATLGLFGLGLLGLGMAKRRKQNA